MTTVSPPKAALAADRPKALSLAEMKRLARKATARPTLAPSHPQAAHAFDDATRTPLCGAAKGHLAANARAVDCVACLALKEQARLERDREAARTRYRNNAKKKRGRPAKLEVAVSPAQHKTNNEAFRAAAEDAAAKVRRPAAEPSVQDDTRHLRHKTGLERFDERTVSPAQIVAAVEVMIASAHARRARDEKAGRPVDRFVWGQLEALRAVVELVRLAANEGV